MKKVLSAVLTAVLIFSPIGNVVFHDNSTTVEAKSYRSGSKSFKSNNNSTNNNNFQQRKRQIPIQPIDLQRLQTQNVGFSQVAG